jgi:hypothetical protein
MTIGPEIQGESIVLRGLFNPAIFHPEWFYTNTLLREVEKQESLDAAITLPDVATFETNWFSFQATKDSMVFQSTQDPYFDRLKDLVKAVLDLVPHTPIRMLGINRDAHLKLRSAEQWHSFGDLLAPKSDIWSPVMSKPGLQSLQIKDSPRDDGYDGWQLVNVQPSPEVIHGVFLHLNDHYDLDTKLENRKGNELARRILSDNWKSSVEKWDKIYLHLAKLAAGL